MDSEPGQHFHAPIISSIPHFNLAMISTANEKSASTAQSLYPTTRIVSDPATLINDPSIELVIIATPNSAHFELARKALVKGKQVVVEKPFTINSAQANT